MKAVLFSYDDGLEEDREMIAILNEYGFKATFNLISGFFGDTAQWREDKSGTQYVSRDEVYDLYQGHEIALHSMTHPNLAAVERDSILWQLGENLRDLSLIVDYEVHSGAYPFGGHDAQVLDVCEELGISNMRTVIDDPSFELPGNLLKWNPSCHDSDALEMIDKFFSQKSQHPELLFIWGHSWEFSDEAEGDRNWSHFRAICEKLSEQENYWNTTCGEFVEFLRRNEINTEI